MVDWRSRRAYRSSVVIQPHPRLFALFGVLVFSSAVALLWWLSPPAIGTHAYLHASGTAQVRVARSKDDLDDLVRGVPAHAFLVPDHTEVLILSVGVARAEVQLVDGRRGWVPAEWVK